MKEFWDQRYSQKEYAYGETPNEYFRKEIELAPKNATAHYNLGIALSQAGDTAGANASFETAKALDPNLPQFKNR